jgi:hypothetical protein
MRPAQAFGGKQLLNVIKLPPLTNIPFSYHLVTGDEEGRLDLVAAREYGNPSYFWIIAVFNSITDPFNGFSAQDRLLIPAISVFLERWSAGQR